MFFQDFEADSLVVEASVASQQNGNETQECLFSPGYRGETSDLPTARAQLFSG